MRQQYDIQVRKGDGTPVETIRRTIQSEAIGNFVAKFCRHKGKECLVESDELHLDDPLRSVEAEHVGKLFIRPRNKEGVVVQNWEDAR